MTILSIIVPTYNVEEYIGKCLDSLVIRRDDFEVLVIIDGSKDKSYEIALGYQEEYPNIIKVIQKKNGHYGSCINVGLSVAKGKYVKVLDADDSFGAGFNDYISYLRKVDTDLVLTDYVVVDELDKVVDKKALNLQELEIDDLWRIVNSNISMMRHYQLTYRTELLRDISYYQTEGISYTDIEWSFLPFRKVSTFSYLPVMVYRYLKGRSGQTVDLEYRKKNMWMENSVVLGIAEKYEEFKKELKEENSILLKRFLSNYVRQVYFHYLINYRGELDVKELKDFDTKLYNTSNEIYSLVEDTKDIRRIGTFYYIRDFRKSGTKQFFKYTIFDIWLKIRKVIHQG